MYQVALLALFKHLREESNKHSPRCVLFFKAGQGRLRFAPASLSVAVLNSFLNSKKGPYLDPFIPACLLKKQPDSLVHWLYAEIKASEASGVRVMGSGGKTPF